MALEELKPSEKKALYDLKLKLEESITKNQLFLFHPIFSELKRSTTLRSRIASCTSPESTSTSQNSTNVALWGVPLLPSRSNDCLDTVLLKFMRAREFKLSETLEMIQRTLRWRNEFCIDGILKEDLESENFIATTYMDGCDKEGHPVCYNVYGLLKEGGLYQMAFGNKEKLERFLRWRVQFMERGIQEFVTFKFGGASAMVHVIDLKDLLGSSMKELRSTIERMIRIFQDNYPEFIVKNIFLNVSLRYYTCLALFSPLLTPKTKSKFVFARPNKVTETLLKYIDPENLPIQYGGFKTENNDEFIGEDGRVSETYVRGGSTTLVEIQTAKPGVTIVWEIIVVGWEVMYKEEFMPDDEGSYKVLIREGKKLDRTTRNSFYIHEPGKLVITIENRTSKKKAIFYRSKARPTFPCYNMPGKN